MYDTLFPGTLGRMDVQFGVSLATALAVFAVPQIERLTPVTMTDSACPSIATQELPASIDMDRVRDAWLGWYNDERSKDGLPPYSPSGVLDHTAGNWSYYAVKRGTIDHKRSPQAPYYDYAGIERWFSDRGVTFDNVRSKTFTENIGWGVFSCRDRDCTDELIAAIRTTFDFFMSEKGETYSPHYNAIVSDAFTQMGLGIALDPARKRYYLTAHFATSLASVPADCR